jgi:acyl-CoA hydrolase
VSPRRIRAAHLELREFIRPGDRIVWGQATGEPLTLTETFLAQRHAIGPVSVFLGSCFSDTLRPEHADTIRFRSFGPMGTSRALAKAGVLDIIPVHFGQIHRYIRDGQIGCDVAFVQLSPPGPNGQHSFGLTNDYVQTLIATAPVVIAEVNDQLPWTYNEGAPDLSRITAIVETSRPPIQLTPPRIGPIEQAIAANVARYIEDGSVLQMGVGAIPEAVMAGIADRRNLGLHTGMVGDSLVGLIERGILTNATKPFDTGISVAGVLLGTDRLYRFADRNPALLLRPSWHTHAGDLLRIPKLVSINAALEVDLTGQVNAEAAGEDLLGAVGGQPDLVRAGHRSSGGHAIIALPSTARGGRTSRICKTLNGPVTTPRSDVDVIVTEYGAADLRGLSLSERARALAAIAHPEHRDGLLR